MPAEQSAEFQQAVKDSEKLKTKPGQNEMLQLYAHFKQGRQDPPFDQVKKPGMLDLTGKAKYGAWEELANKNMSPEDAQKKYVELVESYKEKYGFDG